MSDIKLTYFPAKGRAEIARIILSYSGKKFTDERLSGEQFGAIKSSLPYTQIPVLDYKGEVICQSLTIARFLAAESGLTGRNNLENAQANEIVDAVADLQNAFVKVFFAKDQDGVMNALDKTYPAGLANLEKILKSRGGQFFVGNNLTWADLVVFQFVNDGMANTPPKDLKAFPNIADLCKRVAEFPNIKSWLAARPVTNM
eukprot:GFUD01011939.1.p1 GENE.GFUD01011939.1~~GFUD01011939.1.p1  ORF type:complete len:210 (-),score=56.02 GFUD01011939.1:177-779(-)